MNLINSEIKQRDFVHHVTLSSTVTSRQHIFEVLKTRPLIETNDTEQRKTSKELTVFIKSFHNSFI